MIAIRIPCLAVCGVLLASLSLLAPPAWASANLALEKGCMKCHGEPPRNQAPSFSQLARDYAPYRGQEQKIQSLSKELIRHNLFGNVDAHERLSPQEATVFVRWLVDGGQ